MKRRGWRSRVNTNTPSCLFINADNTEILPSQVRITITPMGVAFPAFPVHWAPLIKQRVNVQ